MLKLIVNFSNERFKRKHENGRKKKNCLKFSALIDVVVNFRVRFLKLMLHKTLQNKQICKSKMKDLKEETVFQ